MRSYSWLLAVLGAFAVAAFLVYAGFADTIETPWAVVGGVGGALILGWIWLDREAIGRTASTRGAKFTLTSISMTLLGLAIAVAFNVLSDRYDQRWDVTAGKKFTLSDQTLSVVAGLDSDIEVLAFFTSGSDEETQFKDLVSGYEEHSDHIHVQFHDPLREPMLAQQNAITSAYGTVVLRSGEDTQRLENDFGEEALSNAIIRLTSGVRHAVCFTEGHGELDPDDSTSPTGLGAVIVKLKGQNYTEQKVSLLRSGGVPTDCEILVAADPQEDWLPQEREMAAAFVAGGGKLVMMLDPLHAPQLAADMGRYGISVGDDLVLEQNPTYSLVGGDISYIFLDQGSFDPHPITTPIKGAVLLRVARSVAKKADAIDGINVQQIASTTAQGWAETNLDGATPPSPDPGQDTIGNVPLMAVAEITRPEVITVGSTALGSAGGDDGRGVAGILPGEGAAAAATPSPEITRKPGGKVVVIGDTDFATNELVDQVSNQDLFLNTLAWLAGEEDQISIRPNPAAAGTLSMNLVQGVLMWLIALLFVPGAAVVGALVTWWRRRSQ